MIVCFVFNLLNFLFGALVEKDDFTFVRVLNGDSRFFALPTFINLGFSFFGDLAATVGMD